MQRKKFHGLNYSCGNEDYRIDTMLIPDHCQTIMSVATTGGQIIPFLAKHPSKLSLVDMSEEQLVIAELRFQTLLMLSYRDFLTFWGYTSSQENFASFRKQIISKLHMTSDSRKRMLMRIMDSCDYKSPLYAGKWDRTAIRLSDIYGKILGKNGLKIFDCEDVPSQERYLKENFPWLRLKAVIFFASSLATLYSALRHKEVPARTSSWVFFKEYKRIFSSLFTHTPVRQNFFLQLILLGKIAYQEAYPAEAHFHIFNKAKNWASHCLIEFIHDDIISAASNANFSLNFLDLSNVNSYFDRELKNNYLQRISVGLAAGALVFTRNFLSAADALNTAGFENISGDFINLFAQEYTQIYSMSLFKKS